MAIERRRRKSSAVKGVTRRMYHSFDRIRELSTVALPTTEREEVECMLTAILIFVVKNHPNIFLRYLKFKWKYCITKMLLSNNSPQIDPDF
jgi:hypothetical protein